MTMTILGYGLEAMEDFLTYNELDSSSDADQIMEQIVRSASQYLEADEISLLYKAYRYAAKAHSGQVRLSGEPYIVHPLRATQILLTLKPDVVALQTCILHDVIEDTDITYEDIKAEFGNEVATLCEALVKVSKVRYHGEDRQIETLKKTFLAMASDLRVIFVKLADRIHNIQTLHFHPKEEKKIRIAQETLKIYVPICKRLGLYQFQLYLENGVFKILHPEEYQQVISYLKKKYPHADRDLIKGKIKLEKILRQNGITHFEITGRVKSPYRIYEKLTKKYNSLDFSKVLDVMAFRVVVDSIPECYNVLGIIHSTYNPLINKIKDYIAIPKGNDYQSLHTTILGLFMFPIEIQIRTKTMDTIAEFGVAAHFLYKDSHKSKTPLTERQSQWLAELQESVHKYQTEERKEDFKDKLAIELLDNTVFIYTPKGDIIELTKGSTVLDFAFRVHTDVGLQFKNALVNNSIKPISHVLQSGDIVSINTYKNRYTATKYWIDYLHTPTAKQKLIRFIKQQERESYIQKGIKLLDAKLQLYKLPSVNNDKDQIRKHYGTQFEQIMSQIAHKSISPSTIIKEVYNISAEPKKIVQPTPTVPTGEINKVLIDDSALFEYELCQQCHPTPQDKIIARSGKNGIKIHTLNCKALHTLSLDKLIKAYRSFTGPEELYRFDVLMACEDNTCNVVTLLATLQELGITIEAIAMHPQSNGSSHIHIAFSHENPSKIAYIIRYLHEQYGSHLHITTKIS